MSRSNEMRKKTTNMVGVNSPWKTSAVGVVALAAAAPIVATLIAAFSAGGPDMAMWSRIGFDYLAGTIVLVRLGRYWCPDNWCGYGNDCHHDGVSGSSVSTGIMLALPFAIPAYVAAYTYADLMAPFGLIASFIGAKNLPEIRSLPGAAFRSHYDDLSIYVYLAVTASLAGRSSALLEAARSLGASPAQAARRILLGAGRPALVGGLALALMETAADYGVADFFGARTLSVGIFRTWYGLGDLGAATQLAGGLFPRCTFISAPRRNQSKRRREQRIRSRTPRPCTIATV